MCSYYCSSPNMIRSAGSYQLVSEPAYDFSESRAAYYLAPASVMSMGVELSDLKKDLEHILDLALDLNKKLTSLNQPASVVADRSSSETIDVELVHPREATATKASAVVKKKQIQSAKMRAWRRRRQLLRRRFRHWRRRVKCCYIVPAVIVGGKRCIQNAIRRRGKIPNYSRGFKIKKSVLNLSLSCLIYLIFSRRNSFDCYIFEHFRVRNIFLNSGCVLLWLISGIILRICWDPGGILLLLIGYIAGQCDCVTVMFSNKLSLKSVVGKIDTSAPFAFVKPAITSFREGIVVSSDSPTAVMKSRGLSIESVLAEEIPQSFWTMDRVKVETDKEKELVDFMVLQFHNLMFKYLLKLNFVCVEIGGLEDGPENKFLCNFFPDDNGLDLPHQYTNLFFGNEAKKFFEKMETVSVITWNAMISGLAQTMDQTSDNLSAKYRGMEALRFYMNMNRSTVKPDYFTFSSALTICSRLGNAEHGEQLHAQTMKAGALSDMIVGSSHVNMYNKCGNMKSATKAFLEMAIRTLISWISMVTGYAQNGMSQEAPQLFEDMILSGVEPNQVTFVGFFSTYSHAGKPEEARHYFNMMINEYGIKPMLDHYVCLIGLYRKFRLGRVLGLMFDFNHSWMKCIGRVGDFGLAKLQPDGSLSMETRVVGKLEQKIWLVPDPEHYRRSFRLAKLCL